MTLTDLCRRTRNYFDVSRHFGEFEIRDGNIQLDFLLEGQFFRIIGSVFNDGVYKYDETLDLKDETFKGAIWALAITKDFENLLDEINQFNAKVDELGIADKGYSSESFGGYARALSMSAPAYMVEWAKRIDSGIAEYRKLRAV